MHGFAGRALDALDGVKNSSAWAMTLEEQAETLCELTRLEARLTELRWRVLSAAEHNEIGAKDGSTSTAAWLSRQTRTTRVRTNADLRGALALDDPRFAVTPAAFAAGDLNEEQVWVIVRAIGDLPDDEVTEQQRESAQLHLVGLAAEHDAKQLRVLARRLFEVLAPDETDKREGEALEREERRAREKARFAIRDNGDGTSSGWFKLPTLQAVILDKAVHAFAAPRRQDPKAWHDADGPQGSLRTAARPRVRRARRAPARRPGRGGPRHRRSDLGLRGTAAGLQQRDHPGRARVALVVRDKGCTAEGCDRPPAWCEAHHEEAWSEGGGTSVDRGRLLCPAHHHLAHDTRYDMRRLPSGQVRFHKRT